jgi:hypothetical protein
MLKELLLIGIGLFLLSQLLIGIKEKVLWKVALFSILPLSMIICGILMINPTFN